LRRHSKTKRGAIGSPFCIFGEAENYRSGTLVRILRTIIVELGGCCDDAKLHGGDAGSSPNAGGGAGRVTRRDLWFVAGQVAPSSEQG
jgi:hypothetical protein